MASRGSRPGSGFADYRDAEVPGSTDSAQSVRSSPSLTGSRLQCRLFQTQQTNMGDSQSSDVALPVTDIRFVKLENGTPADEELMQKAYQRLLDSEVEGLRWVSEAELRSQLIMDARAVAAMYVIHPYFGHVYDLLKNAHCRAIYGPMCVLYCVEQNVPLPRERENYCHISNMVMRDVRLCCTNVPTEARRELHGKVTAMGGKYSNVLSDNVTHLVTPNVGSKKYWAACQNRKHVVLPEWVEELWKFSSAGVMDCNNQAMLDKYRVPIFKGLAVCVSQYIKDERKRFQSQIEANGGEYHKDLQNKRTSHLVCSEPKGEKYGYAVKWNLPVVLSAWITDSLSKGYCVDWNARAYSVIPPARGKTPDHIKQGANGLRATSTPVHDAKRLDTSLDISAISKVKTQDDVDRLGPLLSPIKEEVNEIILAENTIRPTYVPEGKADLTVGPRSSNEENREFPDPMGFDLAAALDAAEVVGDTVNVEKKDDVFARPQSTEAFKEARQRAHDAKQGMEKAPEAQPDDSMDIKPIVDVPLARRILALEPVLATQRPRDPDAAQQDLLKAITRTKSVRGGVQGGKKHVGRRVSSGNKRGCLVWSQAERNPFKPNQKRKTRSQDDNREEEDAEEDMDVDEDDEEMEDEDQDMNEAAHLQPLPNRPPLKPPSGSSSSSSGTLSTASRVPPFNRPVSLLVQAKSSKSEAVLPGPVNKVLAVVAMSKHKSVDQIPIGGARNLPPVKPRSLQQQPPVVVQRTGGAVSAPPNNLLTASGENATGRNAGKGNGGKVAQEVVVLDDDEDDILSAAADLAEAEDRKLQEEKTKAAKPKLKPVFSLSGISSEADRKELFAAIEKLGGIYLDTSQYDPACTHLIISAPSRNEKYLACLAAGKWVLHAKYLTDSLKTGHFLPETMYEWGNMEHAASLNSTGATGPNALALAAHRARLAVSSTGKKAFEGWRVITAVDSGRMEGYRRLLEAGGATVITEKAPYFTHLGEATHFLHEEKKVKLSDKDLERVRNAAGVAYHPIDYLPAVLVDPPNLQSATVNNTASKAARSRPLEADRQKTSEPQAKRSRQT